MITQDYTTKIIGENTVVTMMSPYGGTIYVDINGDTDCEVTIEGAIDMPYFIQGKKGLRSMYLKDNYLKPKSIHRTNNQ